MKRSAQVALVLMGVTGTTATAAYMMPSRADCQVSPAQLQPAPAAAAPPLQALPPGVTPRQPSPCRSSSGSRSYHSWGNWGWNSDRDYRGTSTQRPSSSVSTALTSGRVSAVSSTSSSSSSSSSVARGGFGSTGHGMSGGSFGS